MLLVCYSVQAGLNGYAAFSMGGGTLSCKNSLLVGWGGATDHEDDCSCPVVGADRQGSSLELEGCTIQLHPDSKHSLFTALLDASAHAQVKAVNCKFVGPVPENCTDRPYGVALQEAATMTLVGGGVVHAVHMAMKISEQWSSPEHGLPVMLDATVKMLSTVESLIYARHCQTRSSTVADPYMTGWQPVCC
jgi:hypothetical protein